MHLIFKLGLVVLVLPPAGYRQALVCDCMAQGAVYMCNRPPATSIFFNWQKAANEAFFKVQTTRESEGPNICTQATRRLGLHTSLLSLLVYLGELEYMYVALGAVVPHHWGLTEIPI